MEYTCTLVCGKHREEWKGEMRLVKSAGSFCEAEITGRGTYFHVIVGQHLYGHYICIPNRDVGSELSGLGDLFWNTERLSGLMGKADAVTVANGLCHLEKLTCLSCDTD